MALSRYETVGRELQRPLGNTDVFTSQNFARYALEQQDPVAGTEAGELRLVEAENSWALETSLPVSLVLPKSDSISPGHWQTLPETEWQGAALWKYSLGYLPSLLSEFDASADVEAALHSAWVWSCSEEWASRAAEMSSLRHALAIRLRSMAMLRVLYKLKGTVEPPEVSRFAISDALYVMKNRDEIFSLNNHGAMLAMAAVHVGILFPELDVYSSDRDARQNFGKLGWESLGRIVRESFDAKGVANENSPAYHLYWNRILAQFRDFHEVVPPDLVNSIELEQLEIVLSLSERALEAFVGYSGLFVPIGDSHATPFRTGAEDRILISETSGFAIYRRNGTMLTVNCGHASFSHKHCDDTAITLQRHGVDLILDAGFFGHDWHDPRVIYTKSQRAHSGLFVTGLDGFHPGALYNPGNCRVRGKLREAGLANFDIECLVNIDGRLALERSVSVISDTHIQISDRVHDVDPALGAPVRRFLIPLGAEIAVQPGCLVVSLDGVQMELHFDELRPRSWSAKALPSLRVVAGSDGASLEGWVSPSKNVLTPAYCVEIPVSTKATNRIQLMLSDVGTEPMSAS